ncbi:MAG: ABC transporter ATP-binding protein [Methanothrix sp.]|nr:ABC transporter ATP-binding protein [Methanothrix sp.]OPY50671.1 MAG: Cobalamin import ATP-binding protein BtuD [Methanosaeta sp. PtaU1.Bin055]NLX38824.1 ABC transporter ATP-binding protein [Methanothrix sp.]HNT72735.1 ABC transporter ATP-binding protein [Methanothrix sp.]HOI69696.1 ABC transporter ATP-binding protein [Methanothrix sp.]
MAVKLAITDLSFGYNGKATIKDVFLEVERGEVVSLVGPNGAGKSTLIKCIDRILRPQRGTVLVDGKAASLMGSKDFSRMMGYVPQSTKEIFPYTVFDIVLMGRRPHIGWRVTGGDVKVVAKTLKFMGIEQFASRYFDELSGGEKQKIAMARAIVQEPEILLLDEPTSNLDIKHQLEVMRTVRLLVEKGGISAIMAMHDLNLASRFSDKIVMLKDGRVFEMGRPESVLIPENIEKVYGVRAEVIKDSTGRPYVMPIDSI